MRADRAAGQKKIEGRIEGAAALGCCESWLARLGLRIDFRHGNIGAEPSQTISAHTGVKRDCGA